MHAQRPDLSLETTVDTEARERSGFLTFTPKPPVTYRVWKENGILRLLPYQAQVVLETHPVSSPKSHEHVSVLPFSLEKPYNNIKTILKLKKKYL